MLSTSPTNIAVLLLSFLIAPSFSLATPIVFSDFGIDAASIFDTVTAFRGAIGGVNNGNAAGPFATGRREINWDGGGAAAPVLTDMPKDVFQNTREALSRPATTTFSISGAPDPRFGNINPTYTNTFKAFSEPRLFAPTSSIVTEQTFTVPGSKIPATTTAFGAVFTNVTLANTTSIKYLSSSSGSLETFFAQPAAGGLSFLGVAFNKGEVIDQVVITTGNTILGPNNGGALNVVAMDARFRSSERTIRGREGATPSGVAPFFVSPQRREGNCRGCFSVYSDGELLYQSQSRIRGSDTGTSYGAFQNYQAAWAERHRNPTCSNSCSRSL